MPSEDETPLLRRPGVIGSQSKLQVKDYCAGVVALVMVVLGITAIAVVSAYQTLISYEYGIVLDAGSTHTELMVYRWSKDHVIDGTGQVEQIGLCRTKGGGVSNYATKDPSQAGSSLQSCIDSSAKKLVPSYQQRETPIYLGATAGMRLIEDTNIGVSDKIMESVRQTLHKSPFQFRDDYARIISGEEEGVSSWVTVNYIMGNLLQTSSNKNESYLTGALDMGGASTQITFTPSKNEIVPPESIHQIRVYGRNYQLYTHSYLCYGKRESERRFMASLISNKSSLTQNQTINNPCGEKGLKQTVYIKDLIHPPCVQTLVSGVLPVNVSTVTLQGTSNLTQCVKEVQKLFNFTRCSLNKSCSFNGVYQPSTEGVPYLAFSSYYYVISELNLTESEKANISLGGFKEAADKICNQTWAEIIHGKSQSVIPLLQTTCFDAQYIYTLLSKGYHIKDKSTQVKFQNTVNRRSLGWALGFMINATNLIPTEKPEYRVKTEAFLAVVIVGAILISLGILLAIMATRRVIDRKRLNTGGLAI